MLARASRPLFTKSSRAYSKNPLKQCLLLSQKKHPLSTSSTFAHHAFRQQTQTKNWLFPVSALASATAITALVGQFGTPDHHQHSVTQNEAAFLVASQASGTSLHFRQLQRLDKQEEMQKTKVASFLRELHDLAKEAKQQEAKVTLTRKLTRHMTRTKSEEGISLPPDLEHITPEHAQSIIDLIHQGNKLDRESLVRLTSTAYEAFKKEATLVDLRDRKEEITVVGDLHGTLGSLQSALQIAGDLENNILIITGDYIDRGGKSVEVLCTMLLLKLAHPNNVILLRGNHEDEMICSVYGFLEEIKSYYSEKQDQKAAWEAITGVFSSLPIAARTESVLMMHGGLPSKDFELSELEAITPEERLQVTTVVESRTDHEKLLEMILWSDPSFEDGVHESPRGCGVEFGPDVAADFLERHNLKYIVRSHLPVEAGIEFMDCGGGQRGVVTVFSVAGYLDESSKGATLKISQNGNVRPVQFDPIRTKEGPSPYEDLLLRPLIEENRSKLTHAFEASEKSEGKITVEKWATIMATQLELPDIPWLELAPTPSDPDSGSIDWRAYLRLVDGEQTERINQNKEKLLQLFHFMDKDGNGMIDRQEFIEGIEMLNRDHLSAEEQIKNPLQFFNSIDVDGSGEIDLEEFSLALETSATLKSIGSSLSDDTLGSLKQNREMLLLAFEFLDADGSGAIDFEEFKTGVELVNKRLPKNQQFQDVKSLFEALDDDGSGDIDLSELNQIFTLL